MSTFERYSYKFFTDKWMFLVIIWFYVVIRYQLLPNVITDVYLPFIICLIKLIWTKTSSIKVFKDKIIYRHKEIPTYFRKEIFAKDIKNVYFKILFFSITEKEYCLIEYDENSKIKSLLINLDRFENTERIKNSLISFFKENGIRILR